MEFFQNYYLYITFFITGLLVGFAFFKLFSKGAIVEKVKLDEVEKYLDELKENLRLETEKLNRELQISARLEAEKSAINEKLSEQKEHFEKLQQQFTERFENLANRIFEEKTGKFKKDSEESISKVLNPLKEQIGEFQKKIDTSFNEQAKEQFSLKKEIERIVSVNEKMTLQTEGLTKALKGDNKVQGNWGEVVLEKILEDSGLRKGEDYILQATEMGLKNAESGSALKPDVVVKLPEEKHIIIDSKVSLTSYERFCSDEAGEEKTRNLKAFTDSVRAHIRGLESKKYHENDKLVTPEFVFMFMPLEGAYMLALQNDRELQSYAWNKKIAIVCPSTLFATLRTIASLWRIEKQNRNVEEIARQGGELYNKFVGFVDDMQLIGKQINAAEKYYNSAMNKLSEGKGNLVKRAENLKILGAKTSKNLSEKFTQQ
ncbi:MAG TPA: DNA recombination protein RmuC, partial [Alphaproteobacteria bacterium]|nr:DNA recombination protein RmuC [Alphaproteobacteria bacterium]